MFLPILCVLFQTVSCANFQEMKRLLDFISRNSTPEIRPRINQSHAVEMFVQVRLYSIVDFEVSNGRLTLSLMCYFQWTDETKRWDKGDFSDIGDIRIQMSKLWMPNIILYTVLSGNGQLLSNDGSLEEVHLNHNGEVTAIVNTIVDIFCEANVLKYPFDEHNCNIYVVVDRTAEEVSLTTNSPVIMTNEINNSRWETLRSTYEILKRDGYSFLRYNVSFRRHPTFLCLNMLVPIAILTVANPFVFLLPEESGERLSFSITMFLAFIVFVSSVTDKLPDVSDPISYFNVFLVIQLIYSAVIAVVVVIMANIENKDKSPCPISRIRISLCGICVTRSTLPESSDTTHAVTEENDGSLTKTTDKPYLKARDIMCFIICFAFTLIEVVMTFYIMF